MNQERMSTWRDSAAATDLDFRGFRGALDEHGGLIDVAIVSEEWCPDTYCVLRLLARVSSELPGFRVKVFRASEHEEMNMRLEAAGLDLFPKVVFTNSDGHEIARFTERTATVGGVIKKPLEVHGDPAPYFQSDDESEKKTGVRIAEKIGTALRAAHETELWQATADELAALLSRG